MLRTRFTHFAVRVNRAIARPSTFAYAFLSILLWLFCGPLFHWDDTWQLFINTATTIITFLMVFLIHHAQHVVQYEQDCEQEHEMTRAGRFVVEYTYGRPGGSTTRTSLATSVTQLTYPAQSETAVLAYLKRRHPGLDVMILSLQWQHTNGTPA